MKYILIAIIVITTLSGCTPVQDPSRWDPGMYCRTVQEIFGPDPWCKENGY